MKELVNTTERGKFVNKFLKRVVPVLKKQNKDKGKQVLTLNEQFLLDLGQVIAEIETCFQVLILFPKIITSHSSYYEKIGFSRIQQHRKNIESYFNEVYILKQRTERLLKILRVKLVSSGYDNSSQEIILLKGILQSFLKSIDGLVVTRGEHVHRFSYQDKDLYHMELLEVVTSKQNFSDENKKMLRSDMFFYLKMDRAKWKKTITDNNEGLEQIFGNIYSLIKSNSLIAKCLSR